MTDDIDVGNDKFIEIFISKVNIKAANHLGIPLEKWNGFSDETKAKLITKPLQHEIEMRAFEETQLEIYGPRTDEIKEASEALKELFYKEIEKHSK